VQVVFPKCPVFYVMQVVGRTERVQSESGGGGANELAETLC
jgi:hypothetical protein